jgi:hypothetical protein
MRWHNNQRDGIRWADLPNERRIWLSLPLDVSDEHCHEIAGGMLTRAVRNRPNRIWVEARNRVEEFKSK